MPLREPITSNILNQTYSRLTARRRYEVWFLRVGLASGEGAWWFRYLIMNPGQQGCANPLGMPVQIWATWFPVNAPAQTFIQGYSLPPCDLTARGESPFHFKVDECGIDENSCRGQLSQAGHEITWDLRYTSSFHVTLSSKGWIGFSRTPHSDATFTGSIVFDGHKFEGNALGFGVQGHNCGYRHRKFWTWSHAYFPQSAGPASTFEALIYEMPLGLVFRRAVFWHRGKAYFFSKLQELIQDSLKLTWHFRATSRCGSQLEVTVDGSGPGLHRLPYLKTDCSGTMIVANNSVASATIRWQQKSEALEELNTLTGAVLEMGGVR